MPIPDTTAADPMAPAIRSQVDVILRGVIGRPIADREFAEAMSERHRHQPTTVAEVEKHLPAGISFVDATPRQRLKAAIAVQDAKRGRPLTELEKVVNLAAAMVEAEEEESNDDAE